MTRQNDSTSKAAPRNSWTGVQLIEETYGVRPQNAKHPIHCPNIIGQVRDTTVLPEDTKTTKHEHVLPALVAIEQIGRSRDRSSCLGHHGRRCEAGPAIAEMIAGMHTPTVSWWWAAVTHRHSPGSERDVSFIVPSSASMTVHSGAHQRAGAGCAADYRLF